MPDDTGNITGTLPQHTPSMESHHGEEQGLLLVIPPKVDAVAFGHALQDFLNSKYPTVRIEKPNPF